MNNVIAGLTRNLKGCNNNETSTIKKITQNYDYFLCEFHLTFKNKL